MNFTAIEGNIGSGKTTLASLLAAHYNAKLILEEFAQNPFLPKFYADAERFAFPLELSFLADRYHQLNKHLLPTELFQQQIVSDYLFVKSKLFARLNLKDDEYQLFQKVFDIMQLQLPQPDLLIYLQSPIALLKNNIKKRGRSYEQNISEEYLEHINGVYGNYLRSVKQPILLLDMGQIDFVNNADHLTAIISVIDKKVLNLPAGMRFLD